MTPEFTDALARFLDYTRELVTCTRPKQEIGYEVNKRYIRVFTMEPGADWTYSAFCFIDLTNGDILKAASWKAPAKHARGNIFDADVFKKWLTPYGPAYIR